MVSISIITVCLNAENGILQTANSIQGQTNKDYEWIVVDGESSDNTLDILNKFNCIDHIISEKDAGIYDAMNKGIRRAKGRYCLFLNAGDSLYDQLVLERMQSYLHSDIIVGHIYKMFPDDTNKNKIAKFYTHNINKKYFYYRSLPHQSTFIRRKLFFENEEYETSFKILGDHDFFARVIFHGASVSFVPFCVAVYQMNGISTTLKNSLLFKNEMKMIRRRNFSFLYRMQRTIFDSLIKLG